MSSHGIQVGGFFRGLAKHPQVPPTHLKSKGIKGEFISNFCLFNKATDAVDRLQSLRYTPNAPLKDTSQNPLREFPLRFSNCNRIVLLLTWWTTVTRTPKITYVIHEHDDYVWRWNISWLLCQGTAYHQAEKSQSFRTHHSLRYEEAALRAANICFKEVFSLPFRVISAQHLRILNRPSVSSCCLVSSGFESVSAYSVFISLGYECDK